MSEQRSDDKGFLNLLVVADLHFGHGSARTKADQRIVIEEIVRDAERLAAIHGSPDAVLVVGDIAYKADTDSEYADASRWLTRLCSHLKCDVRRLLAVPGNHDIARARGGDTLLARALRQRLREAPYDLDDALAESSSRAHLCRKLEAYNGFVRTLCSHVTVTDTSTWECVRPTALGLVRFVGLNTVLLSYGDDDSNTNLMLGKRQMHEYIQAPHEDTLLVVLQHHPPSWLRDGLELTTLLNRRPHLLLTGHIHNQAAVVTFDLTGGAVAHLGVGAGHGDSDGEHGYAWLRLSPEGLHVLPRAWITQRRRFDADRNSFPDLDSQGQFPILPDRLPPPLRNWLARPRVPFSDRSLSVTGHTPPPPSIVGRVARLLSLRGYGVEREVTIAGRTVALVANDTASLRPTTYVVGCYDAENPLGIDEYSAFIHRLSDARRALTGKVDGLIIATVGFTAEVEMLGRQDGLALQRLSDLERSIIDFTPYVAEQLERLAADPALSYFVEPSIVREGQSHPVAALHALNQWLHHPTLNQLTLLGDYGTGKTTLLKAFMREAAIRFMRDTASGGRTRVPLFVDLRDYTQAISLKQIILEMLDSHGISAHSYAAFEYLLKDGQILLILDGFDEMASRGNLDATLRNFRELNKSALEKAKIVLSCRTHYFHTERHLLRFLGHAAPVGYTDLYREIARKPNFMIVHLQDFTPDQKEQYLLRRCQDSSASVDRFIRSTYDLGDLSRRPVLLDMIVTSWRSLSEEKGGVTTGILYLRYTDLWLGRNDWQLTLDIEAKTQLLERFAIDTMADPDTGLSFEQIPHLIKSWRADLNSIDAQTIDRELRTAAFLIRTHDGFYRFSHKSFREFFFARALLSEAAAGRFDRWEQGAFTREIYTFLRDLLALRRTVQDRLLEHVRSMTAPAWGRTNAIKCLAPIRGLDGLAEALDHVARVDSDERVAGAATIALGYHPRPDTFQTLCRLAHTADAARPNVAVNALVALTRTGLPEAAAFVADALDDPADSNQLDAFQVSAVARALLTNYDPVVFAACLRYSSKKALKRRRDLEDTCLELCARHPSDVAEAFCKALITRTESLTRAAKAFSNLSLSSKRVQTPQILNLLNRFPRDAGANDLMLSLRGVGLTSVEKFICEKLGERGCHYASAAHEVLAHDFPATADHLIRNLTGRGRRYSLRIEATRAYVARSVATGLPLVESLLLSRQRVAVKIQLLGVIRDMYPAETGRLVRSLWDLERAPSVLSAAMETVLNVDPADGLQLLLERGVTSRRVGVRVAAYRILTAVTEPSATTALLKGLATDDSRWGRLQALRSLLAPGRDVPSELIWGATSQEADPEVLGLRAEFLGGAET
jgi:NACHT domain/Calcineurin-like phosphoesterase/HEAT repeats